MFKFLSYFEDDRKKIIIVIACILVIIYGIVSYFSYFKKVNNNYSEDNDNSSSSDNTTAIIKNETTNSNTEKNVAQNVTTIYTSQEAIQKFINFCNSREINNAYEMLTDDCKEFIFSNNKNNFNNDYINKIFVKQMSYNSTKVENSNDYCEVYAVNFFEDPINKGIIDESNSKNDYITVVEDGNTYKLNVLGFIKKEILNASAKNNYVEVKVLSRLIFFNYEVYNFNIKNDILVDITLDNMEDNSKTYIQDYNEDKFKIMNEQYTAETAKVSNGKEKNISLRFNRKYTANKNKITKIVFSRISVLNRNYYQEVYDDTNNTTSYQERMSTYPAVLSLEINL